MFKDSVTWMSNLVIWLGAALECVLHAHTFVTCNQTLIVLEYLALAVTVSFYKINIIVSGKKNHELQL